MQGHTQGRCRPGYLRAAPPQAAPGLGEEHGPYCWSGHPAREAHGDRPHLHLRRWSHHRQQVCAATGVDESTRVKDLSEADVNKLRAYIDQNVTVEGDLRRDVAQDIKRKMEINCLQGIRHRKGLPVRGQRTRTNARTRKGPKRTVAGKKKVTK